MSVATFAAAQLLRLVPRVRLSRAVGRVCDAPLPPKLSNAVSQLYIRAYGVDMADVDPQHGAYPSFDAFFTRKLRDGARNVDEAAVVSPADGQIVDAGSITLSTVFTVKGQPYHIAELIGDREESNRFKGGSYAVVYLSPRDYHRVHAPVSGTIALVRGLAGDLYPVNRIGERHVPGLLVRNQRVAISIDTSRDCGGDNLGQVVIVLVGATIVGRISVTALGLTSTPPGDHRPDPPRQVSKGDEIGIFHLGSTAVVLMEPGTRIGRTPGAVLMGQSLLDASGNGER